MAAFLLRRIEVGIQQKLLRLRHSVESEQDESDLGRGMRLVLFSSGRVLRDDLCGSLEPLQMV